MAKNYRWLWENITGTSDEAKCVRTLAEILVDRDGRAFVSRLERKDAELCVEILDHGIAEHNLNTAEKQAFFVTLRRLSGHYGRLPDSMVITEKIEVEDKILASGGFADVRRGTYMGHLVAVKALRVAEQDDFVTIRKRFCKEVVLWGTVSHPNVLKFAGVQGDMEKGQFVTVSEWMAHGNIMEYIRNNHANRLELLHGAAQGLNYLHGANLTHGDLKGANILMSNDIPPRPCLADFGFMPIVLGIGQKLSCSSQLEGGAMAFMSPELLVPSRFGIQDSIPTPEADVYAFGLVMFQVLAGEIPFRGVRQAELGWSVVHGLRPTKPENASSIGFSDSLWNFTQRCWDGDYKLRPRVAEVVTRLGGEAANWDGLMPPCAPVENTALDSEGPTSVTLEYCGIFPLSNPDPESSTESLATSGLFDRSNTISTGQSETPQEEPLAVATKPFEEPQPEPRTPVQPDPMEYRGIFRRSSKLVESNLPTPAGSLWSRVSTCRLRGSKNVVNAQPALPLPTIRQRNPMAAQNPFQLLRTLSRSPLKFPHQIAGAPCEKQFRDCVPNLHDDEVVQLIDYLDNVLCTLDPASPTFWKCLHRLGWVCGTRGMLPKSCKIPDISLLNAGNHPFASGALADMYEGFLDGSRVCVEKIRMYSEENSQRVKMTLCREVAIRKHLRHRSIVPFIGATLDPPQLVSAWMSGGSLVEYVTAHPEKSRLRLLYDIAQGLDYLHSHGMIHGDLKACNILVDDTGHARIAGLNLVVVASDVGSTASFTGGPVAWLAAPEILGGGTAVSKEADIFSFAMITVEVFTGATPFTHMPPTTVAVQISSGKRPERPEHPSLTNDLWNLNQRCWDQEPLLRPEISEVVNHLQTCLAVQEGHADGTDVSTTDDTISTNSRKTDRLHRLPYGPPRPTVARWLLALRKPRQPLNYQATFDERSCSGSSGSVAGLYDAKSGEWEKSSDIQHPPSCSHSFLRMVANWLPGRRIRSTQNRGARPDDLSEKHRREEAGMMLPDLISGTSPEFAPTPNNLHPTPVHRGCRLLPCLPSCRSNKYMDQ